MAAVNKEKRSSLKDLISTFPLCAGFNKGALALKSATERAQNTKLINPTVRMAHGKPRHPARLEIKAGKIISPVPPAVAATPACLVLLRPAD